MDWNVVVTVNEGFERAEEEFSALDGPLQKGLEGLSHLVVQLKARPELHQRDPGGLRSAF